MDDRELSPVSLSVASHSQQSSSLSGEMIDDESEDDDVEIVDNLSSINSSWICVCTFVNEHDRGRCDVCDQPRTNVKECSRCSYHNRINAIVCQMCDNPLLSPSFSSSIHSSNTLSEKNSQKSSNHLPSSSSSSSLSLSSSSSSSERSKLKRSFSYEEGEYGVDESSCIDEGPRTAAQKRGDESLNEIEIMMDQSIPHSMIDKTRTLLQPLGFMNSCLTTKDAGGSGAIYFRALSNHIHANHCTSSDDKLFSCVHIYMHANDFLPSFSDFSSIFPRILKAVSSMPSAPITLLLTEIDGILHRHRKHVRGDDKYSSCVCRQWGGDRIKSDIDRVLNELWIKSNGKFRYRHCINESDAAQYILMSAKSITRAPYKGIHDNIALASSYRSRIPRSISDSSEGIRRSRSLFESWCVYLSGISGMSLDRANAIAARYATFRLLIDAFLSSKDPANLLADIRMSASGRRLGPALSNKVYQHFFGLSDNQSNSADE